MFEGIQVSTLFIAIAAVAGLAVGAILSRLLGTAGNRPGGRKADDLDHRIRALEADVRVSQRTIEQTKAERDALTTELGATAAALVALKERVAGHAEAMRTLKAELQHECAKTARLRQELADRAEEQVRTHVQLRDVQTELDVSQVGSDVVIDQINHLERERDDLNTLVEALRKEIDTGTRRELVLGSSKALNQGDELLVDR